MALRLLFTDYSLTDNAINLVCVQLYWCCLGVVHNLSTFVLERIKIAMRITPNFRSKEFVSKDGAALPPVLKPVLKLLCIQLEVIRDYFGQPVIVNSGHRSVPHNRRVGGAPGSFHISAMAADIRIVGYSPAEVFDGIVFLIKEGRIIAGGVKAYDSFVHYDIRGTLTLF